VTSALDRKLPASREKVTASHHADDTTSERDAPIQDESAAPSAVTDPLRWFGILVPPQLRACQSANLGLITGRLVDAVNASRELRRLEAEIRRLRKDIRKADRVKDSNTHGP